MNGSAMPASSIAAAPGTTRQGQIYLDGMISQRRPTVPTGAARLEAEAERAMTPEAFAYIAGSAGRETTAARNIEAFDRWSIVPRMLRDVSVRDLSVTVFGRRLASPLLLAPIGVQEMAHADADLGGRRGGG